MKAEKFEIWLADLNSRFGTEAGKTRPVLVVQSNLLRNDEIIKYRNLMSLFFVQTRQKT